MPRRADLIGKKFGMLTVAGVTDRRKDSYRIWKCRCSCGGTIEADTKRLRRGTVISCGCIRKPTSRLGAVAEDITGRQFGTLTATRRVSSLNGRTRWLCRCTCGAEKTVETRLLKSGKIRHCGNTDAHGSNARIVDLTGRQINHLTALYPTDKRDGKSSVYWHCRCSCGNEVDVTEDRLLYGNYTSCGCKKREHQTRISSGEYLQMVDGTCVEWLRARKHRSDNTSGHQGVTQKKNGRYYAMIGFKGKRYYLGSYEKIEEAVAARQKAEQDIHQGFLNAYDAWKEKAAQDGDWAERNPLVFDVEKVGGELRIRTNMEAVRQESAAPPAIPAKPAKPRTDTRHAIPIPAEKTMCEASYG